MAIWTAPQIGPLKTFSQKHQTISKGLEPFGGTFLTEMSCRPRGHAETFANQPLEEVLCAQCFQEAQFWRWWDQGCASIKSRTKWMWLLLFLFLRSSILYSLHIHVYSFIQYTLFWFIKKTQRSKDHTTWKGPLESHVSPSIQLLGLESRVPGPEVAAIIYIYTLDFSS